MKRIDAEMLVRHAISYIRFDRWDGTPTETRTVPIDEEEMQAINILAGAVLDIRRA